MTIPSPSLHDHIDVWSMFRPMSTSYTQRGVRHFCKFGQLLPFDSDEWITIEW